MLQSSASTEGRGFQVLLSSLAAAAAAASGWSFVTGSFGLLDGYFRGCPPRNRLEVMQLSGNGRMIFCFVVFQLAGEEGLSGVAVEALAVVWFLEAVQRIVLSQYGICEAPSLFVGLLNVHLEDSWFGNSLSASTSSLFISVYELSELLLHPWVIGDSAKEDLMDSEVVSRLQSFNARCKFRTAAIASVLSSTVFLRSRTLLGSHDLTHEELKKLRKHFQRICANGDNATLSEFEQVLNAMNMSSLPPLAPRVFDLFDNNRDGTVDMREILCGFSSLRNSHGDDALQLCFQALPKDCLPADITEPGKLDEIFDQMDANSDGKVTFDEFKAAMKRDSSLQDVVLSSLRPI
ncbi:calcium and calcium/calmodulin-dependent serine/threonine-protein kinase-like [Magnolia sinica]|uniref:calcium and calcium/calmodulin-dependent serine/threonine-protein kinase-like n=1 Tax=Magnolia sinica TaxID=86752 RepID=UPI0026581A73|nr:calcium and calcium/calmodulin-dependent serine/threonine-protein kinase-like [Magnolia sinica]